MSFPLDPYPSYYQAWSTKITRSDDMIAKRTLAGDLHVRLFYAAAKSDFVVIHENFTLAQINTLEAYYQLYKITPFSFTLASDGVTRTCRFTAVPQYVMTEGLGWQATVTLGEV